MAYIARQITAVSLRFGRFIVLRRNLKSAEIILKKCVYHS